MNYATSQNPIIVLGRNVLAIVKKNVYRFNGNIRFMKGSKIDWWTTIGDNSIISGHVNSCELSEHTAIYGNVLECTVGRGTYICDGSFLQNMEIGSFCSIGHSVHNPMGTHPSKDWISTSPTFYSNNPANGWKVVDECAFEEIRWIDADRRVANVVGNDVWIGDCVTVIGGVTIGDGAIIATGAVVVNDVPPYAIVGGVPAKIIRYRFSEEIIDELMRIKWWDRSNDWIMNNAKHFRSIQAIRECWDWQQ